VNSGFGSDTARAAVHFGTSLQNDVQSMIEHSSTMDVGASRTVDHQELLDI